MALVLGTAAGDLLTAGNDGDEIRGLAGNDTVLGGEGTDTLNGNEGQDLVVGRFGADRVYGGQGNDTVIATAGGMIVNGNKGDDLVIGFGNSTVYGGQANDTIYGAEGTANGDLGADLIFGGATMNGGGDPDPDSGVPAGNDTLVGSRGNNTMTGGRGNDQFVFQPEVVKTFNLTFERPVFGNIAGANQVTVTEGGYGGADVITDFAAGPGDGDIVKLVALDLGSTVTIEQVGADVRIRITNATTSPDGLGANSSTNQSANQDITIRNVNIQDFLAVGSNDLEINGEIVNVATPGLAVVNVNNNNSFRFTVRARQGRNIDLSRTGIIGTRLDADFAPDGVPFPSVNNDTIVGTSGADLIAGLAGNDSINAGSGNDTVFGNAGNDTIFGSAGTVASVQIVPVSPDNGPFTGTNVTVTVTDILYGDLATDSLQAGDDFVSGDGGGSNPGGPDFIDGGPGADTLFGNADNDTIFGGAGNDSIEGGAGNDLVFGGGGNDTITDVDQFPADVNTTLYNLTNIGATNPPGAQPTPTQLGAALAAGLLNRAGAPNSFAAGAFFNDVIFGGDGNDSIVSGSGNDFVDGGAGNDVIDGGSTNDVLVGGAGADFIFGGAEADTINGGPGRDTLDGGEAGPTDFDYVYYAESPGGVTVSLAANTATNLPAGNNGDAGDGPDVENVINFEGIIGSNFDDNLTGDSDNVNPGFATGANHIAGLGGNDTINGLGGPDTLQGNDGDDVINGGAGNDIIFGDAGADFLEGGDGIDILVGGAGEDTLVNTNGDILFGGSGDDIYIVSGPNTIISENEATGGTFDVVRITGGGDYANPLQATPQVTIPAGLPTPTANRFANIERIEIATSGAVTLPTSVAPIVSIVSPAVTAGVNVTFAGNDGVVFTSTAFADTIVGGAGADSLVGGAGADSLVGGAGDDSLVGGDGDDSLVGGKGADVLTGSTGADRFVFAIGDSPANAPNIDVITDFAVGVDLIDVPFAPASFGTTPILFGVNTINALFNDPQINAALGAPGVDFIQVNVLSGAITGSYLIFDSNNDGVFNGTPNAAGVVDDIISLGGLLAAPLTAASFV